MSQSSSSEGFRGYEGFKGRNRTQQTNRPPRSSSRERPTHFLAVRISNNDFLRERYGSLQQEMLRQYPDIKDMLINPIKFHLTLFVFTASDESQLLRAKSLFEDCKPIIARHFPPTNPIGRVYLRGVKHFDNRVVYGAVEDGGEMKRLAELTRELHKAFKDASIPVEPFRFNPHMTLMKTKSRFRFEDTMIQRHADFDGGWHLFQDVEFLDMMNKDEHGYYACQDRFPVFHGEEKPENTDAW
eukprot:TRINITY_DN5335_c0_g1_i3.p1 TRINITY_DN5335_c0_g1~~TRINITY_DN5335_c0_g1_i3.p1  ORF type:complete len:242 (+),score=50.37 TRINITY_DN5335_c0_g1_i3:61-786(+)